MLVSIPLLACRDYEGTVGKIKKQIYEFIGHQLAEDQITDSIGLKKFFDPFTGGKNTRK